MKASNYLLYKDAQDTVRQVDVSYTPRISDWSDSTAVGSIRWAIEQVGKSGGLVRIYPGKYPVHHPIIVDWDWITIEGVNKPHWGGWVNFYPTHQRQGNPGGAQIVPDSGRTAILVRVTPAHCHGENRHKALAFRDLYLYGSNKADYGIVDTTNSDVCEVCDCLFQGFERSCMVVIWDAGKVTGSSFQGNDGNGLDLNHSIVGTVTQNTIYDNGGWGIRNNGAGCAIIGNVLGRNAKGHVVLRPDSYDNVVIGNVFNMNDDPMTTAIADSGSTNLKANNNNNGTF